MEITSKAIFHLQQQLIILIICKMSMVDNIKETGGEKQQTNINGVRNAKVKNTQQAHIHYTSINNIFSHLNHDNIYIITSNHQHNKQSTTYAIMYANVLHNWLIMHAVPFMNTQDHLTPDPYHRTRAHQIITIVIGNAAPISTWKRLLAPDPHHRTRAHQNSLPSP